MEKALEDQKDIINKMNVLFVEDNPRDVECLLIMFERSDISHRTNVNVIKNGEEALQFLYKQGKYSSAATPHIVLLDLNLPKMNGIQVLEKIKNYRKRGTLMLEKMPSDTLTMLNIKNKKK